MFKRPVVKRLKSLLFLGTLATVGLSSCNTDGGGDSKSQADSAKVKESKTELIQLSPEKKKEIEDLMESISPPIELTYLLQDLDYKFNTSILFPPEKVNTFISSQQKALALGIYSTDLGYCYVYGRTDLADNYLEVIEQLITELNLAEVIDLNQLKEMNENEMKSEELATELTIELERIQTHLNSTNQYQLSALIPFSSWIESMYIASVVGKELGEYNDEMIELIYYETIMSSIFVDIFSIMNGESESFNSYYKMSSSLAKEYLQAEVKLKKVDSKVVHKDSITSVVSLSEQEISLDDNALREIAKTIENCRNQITNR